MCAACSTRARTRSASTRPRLPTRRGSIPHPPSTARSASWLPSTRGAARPRRPGASPPGAGPSARAGMSTAMAGAGTGIGFDLELTRAVSDAVGLPVIASGGVGTLDHLADGIQTGGADAVLAASIFHYGEYTVGQAKQHLAGRGIAVRR